MMKKTLDYLIRVHTLPEDLKLPKELRPPVDPDLADHEDTSELYQRVIDSRLLWKVWMIDMFGKIWIEVAFENSRGEDEFHTLAIDEGTYRKVEYEPYEAIIEEPKT
ncbi:hypothetical protein [Archangium lipolyticum]|uniref:hypothetical protein n=1 Tax=Archangium lipolyticum TaxID=2970465 RepID=UPI002149AF68|nr:hypothetical protein [Archangium lipolyticum]